MVAADRPVKLSSFYYALLLVSGFALALSLYRMLATDSDRYWFLMWNLFLAWLPLVSAWLLYRRTPKGLNWALKNLSLLLVWLIFLPNAFYLVTDFIHLQATTVISPMFDLVLFATYSWCGFILGYSSLFLVHVRAYQKIARRSHWLVVGSLLLSGLAIYFGRFLRWNSWDIITNPLGLLFDVSESLINPQDHLLTFSTMVLFFIFLSIIYAVIWSSIGAVVAKTSLNATISRIWKKPSKL